MNRTGDGCGYGFGLCSWKLGKQTLGPAEMGLIHVLWLGFVFIAWKEDRRKTKVLLNWTFRDAPGPHSIVRHGDKS